MKKINSGIRAWLVESWYSEEEEAYVHEVRREVFLDRTVAIRAYEKLCFSNNLAKAVLSEIDIIPDHVLRKTVSV